MCQIHSRLCPSKAVVDSGMPEAGAPEIQQSRRATRSIRGEPSYYPISGCPRGTFLVSGTPAGLPVYQDLGHGILSV